MLKKLTVLIMLIAISVLPLTRTEAATTTLKDFNMIVGDEKYLRTDGGYRVDRVVSSKPDIIPSVNSSEITAKKAGTTNLTLYDYNDNVICNCKVKVYSQKQILKKIKVKYLQYEEYTLAVITNNSPVAMEVSLKINYKSSTGAKKVENENILGFFPKQTSVIWIGRDVNSPKITYKINSCETSYTDFSDKIKVTPEVQDEDIYLTIKNKSSTDIDTFDVSLLGYDEDDNLVYAETIALSNALDAKDTREENLPLNYVRDDDGNWQYIKPVKFAIYKRGYIRF